MAAGHRRLSFTLCLLILPKNLQLSSVHPLDFLLHIVELRAYLHLFHYALKNLILPYNGSLSGISSRCIDDEALSCALEFKLYKLIPPFCIIGVLDDEDPYDDLDELGDDLPLPRV
ncbi:hypothetical protein H5410_023519 [Solanum commersonii]|uniref:Uncharacterized protein n=1 Tax=Solanum commersonii TaxID=4109 RepID=A0A9J5ZK32_SOLCO|nr:hypothetical protein H5410_023519 [Solanum commersonii]